MTTEFTIRFTTRTVEGFEAICDFYLGSSREMALSVFAQLEGNEEIGDSDILQVDLTETHEGLPLDIKIKHCSLSQIGRNCCLIVKEVFKYRNLGLNG